MTTVPFSLKTLLRGQLHFMSQRGYEVIVVSSNNKELEEVSEREGVRLAAIDMTRTISPFKDLVSLWNFYKFCKKERPAIVHSHSPKAGIIGMLGAKLAGVPIRLHTIAGLPLMEAKGIKRVVLNLVESLVYRFATKVYPNSKGLYHFVLNNRFTTKDKLKLLVNGSSNGINTSLFSPQNVSEEVRISLKKELGIQENDFVYVFVGRLVGDKGINELVKAFSYLGLQNVKLLLVGPYEEDLSPLQEETLSEINNNPSILSTGFQEDVRPYFAISHALVFPSYREGFPNVVMQAGAMGLPSIVSDINGCNEIIVEGENGVIISPKSAHSLQGGMMRLITDSELYGRLQMNSRRMIVERYEQSVIWNALLEEYNSLLAEKGLRA